MEDLILGKTYCSSFDCVYTDCSRNQHNAPKGLDISIADLSDGWCYTPQLLDKASNESYLRKKLLAAICSGTQKTGYRCDETCRAMCGSDGTCAYCSAIADAVEEVLK